ncbi:DUF5103 domain-containing protein [Sphingobacterium spiritivorum]|uniref:type IX secretion system plug protein n=1 Tax=Sphingobacterium spiritivorum TaxID=258 RepID=UPI003DA34A30
MNKCIALGVVFFLIAGICYGQKKKKKKDNDSDRSPKQELIYDNINYLPTIQSVQLYPGTAESTLPVIDLEQKNQLLLSFDDLRADIRNFYFSIEHCDANWMPSRLSPLEYAEGFNEGRIDNYSSSKATFQPYTNYQVNFPDEYVGPKLPGNYLLKVYEDADKSRLILTRKFYVIRKLMSLSAKVTPSTIVSLRNKNQKLDVFVKTGAVTVTNPQRDLRVVALQNQRTDNMMSLSDPMFAGGSEINYNNSQTLDFKGNNEFRYVDLRSLKLGSERVSSIRIDSLVRVDLHPDEDNSTSTYASTFDENGKFYIRNMDQREATLEGDYAQVTFSLKTDQTVKGDIYIVGGFNNYQRTSAGKLHYNENLKLWQVVLPLKQGLYDYEYVLQDPSGKVITDAFSGSFYQTGNNYQILLYNRKIGTFWDELLGFGEVSINNRK